MLSVDGPMPLEIHHDGWTGNRPEEGTLSSAAPNRTGFAQGLTPGSCIEHSALRALLAKQVSDQARYPPQHPAKASAGNQPDLYVR